MNLNKAIEDMNKTVKAEEVLKPVEAELLEPVKKKVGRPKVIDDKKKEEIIRVAEKVFFMQSIASRVGIYKQRINEELRRDEEFASALMHARDKWIDNKQALLEDYAYDKKEADWRAIKYLLTIADKEFSERKYLTEAVSNQEAKILMLIKAEKLTLASEEGKKMLETADIKGAEAISLKPFKVKKPKPETVKNKGQITPPPPVQ